MITALQYLPLIYALGCWITGFPTSLPVFLAACVVAFLAIKKENYDDTNLTEANK